MSLKDKLEIGLKPDAPYRRDNLPEGQQNDSACHDAAHPDDERARDECDERPITPVEKPLEKVTDEA